MTKEVIKMTSQEAKTYLLDFLRKNKIDQKEFAKMIGKSEVTISRWLNSDKPLSESNINAIKFIIWSYSSEKSKKEIPSLSRLSGDVSFDVPPPIFVPLLTVAQAAEVACHTSGDPATNIQVGEQSGFMHPKPGDFAIVVSGSSMMPWYPPGTHILVGRDEIPKTGDRVAAMLAERTEPVFKVFIDHGDSFELLSINERDGLQPIRLNKMDRTEWYWCWPIKESKRDERALDAAMREFGIHHFWEKKVQVK